jgi:hypothetical protein
MRTTIDIAEPVLDDLRALQKREGKTLGELVSGLLAGALAAERHKGGEEAAEWRWIAKDLRPRLDLRDKEALWLELDRESLAGR